MDVDTERRLAGMPAWSRSTLLGLTPHTIYFSDRPQRIVGHLTTHRFLQWWSEGDDSFAVDPPNAVLAWGEPGTDAPEEAVMVISDPSHHS